MLHSRFDLAGLDALMGHLTALASPSFQRGLEARLAAAALGEVRREFEEGHDPQDQPWAPLRRRVGRPLYRTGRLASSFGARLAGGGFTIGSSLAFASFHQDGTATLQPRPMLPEGQLGPAWTRALEGEVVAAVEWLFGSEE